MEHVSASAYKLVSMDATNFVLVCVEILVLEVAKSLACILALVNAGMDAGMDVNLRVLVIVVDRVLALPYNHVKTAPIRAHLHVKEVVVLHVQLDAKQLVKMVVRKLAAPVVLDLVILDAVTVVTKVVKALVIVVVQKLVILDAKRLARMGVRVIAGEVVLVHVHHPVRTHVKEIAQGGVYIVV